MKLCEESNDDLDKMTFSGYTSDMIQRYYKQYEKEDYYFKRCRSHPGCTWQEYIGPLKVNQMMKIFNGFLCVNPDLIFELIHYCIFVDNFVLLKNIDTNIIDASDKTFLFYLTNYTSICNVLQSDLPLNVNHLYQSHTFITLFFIIVLIDCRNILVDSLKHLINTIMILIL